MDSSASTTCSSTHSDCENNDSFIVSTERTESFVVDPERKALLDSISLLSSHVSESVVEFLVQKVKIEERITLLNTSQPLSLEVPVRNKSTNRRISQISNVSSNFDDSGHQPLDALQARLLLASNGGLANKAGNNIFEGDEKEDVSDLESCSGSDEDSISSSGGEDSDSCSDGEDSFGDIAISSLAPMQSPQKSRRSSMISREDMSENSITWHAADDVLDDLLCSSDEEPDDVPRLSRGESQEVSEVLDELLCSSSESEAEDAATASYDDIDESSSEESGSDDSSYDDFMDYCLPLPQTKKITSDSMEVTGLRQSRTAKALDTEVMSLASGSIISGSVSVGDNDSKTQQSMMSNRSNFTSIVHTGALCLIDISGFTKLSQCLELDSLSTTINDFFQMIVQEISAFGGDVVKFAGDALIAEWEVDSKQPNNDEVVLLATMCATAIVKKCSDFPVVIQGVHMSTLNVHCGIGFGEIIGAHVGGDNRQEYLILGEAIKQVAGALDIAQQGEAGASPQVLKCLAESVDFVDKTISEKESPQIIAYKSKQMFKCKKRVPTKFCTNNNTGESVVSKCSQWDAHSLEVLRKYMSKYVHPVVLGDDGFSNRQSTGNSAGNEKSHSSNAELRDVFTVFIQPQSDFDFMGKDARKTEVVQLLNEIMLIIDAEVSHFKGQLRQFIIDDKGLVIIANFGLRGSTFPNMIEERAMPCLTNIKTLLRTELSVECKLGATYGKAYCGVVGGVHRHEYAILGPSVNLAARLMAHKENPGILVDEAVKRKASSQPFLSLPPVKAKGYSSPVKIFKPESLAKKAWHGVDEHFVGRQQELEQLSSLALKTLADGASKIVLVSGAYGYGKSSLLAQGVEKIESMCESRGSTYFSACHIFGEEESFQPFSIIRPLLLQYLKRMDTGKAWSKATRVIGHSSDMNGTEELDEAKLYVNLLQVCMEARIPLRYVEIFGGLAFTSKLSDIGKWSERNRKMSEWKKVVENFVEVILHFSRQDDLIVLALDDISGMDEMSWKIVELLYERAKKVLVMGACRNQFDLNIHPEFKDKLEEDDIETDRFTSMRLGPLDEEEIRQLCINVLATDELATDDNITRIAHIQSDGNPYMAISILKALYMDDKTSCAIATKDYGEVEELLLGRLDSLSATARLHLNLGAIMGYTFALDDLVELVAVLDGYNKVQQEEKDSYFETVHMSLCEAVQQGILNFKGASSFTFTHQFWLDNILMLTLDSWKEEMITLFRNQSGSLSSHLSQSLTSHLGHSLTSRIGQNHQSSVDEGLDSSNLQKIMHSEQNNDKRVLGSALKSHIEEAISLVQEEDW